ncbi:MAG: hypothetical protein MUF51_03480 [Vicinamibacteria bacterium]|nr:hypothetical protein [Vicinamibacteria bacterium]
MLRSSFGLIVRWIAALVLAAPIFLSADDLEKRVDTEYCALTDDPSAHVNRLVEIELLGEPARKALLSVASSKKPQAGCALHYLFDLKDQRAIPIIRKILRDPRADVGMKESAIAGVGVFKDMESLDEVLEAFQSGRFIGQAPLALAALRDERGLRALREALKDPKLRFAVVDAVGFYGHVEAVELLKELMDDPRIAKYGFMRMELVLSLGRIGTPRSRRLAFELYDSTKDEKLRRGLSLDLFGVFLKQRRQSRDEAEIRDINEYMSKLRTDPGASESIKAIP